MTIHLLEFKTIKVVNDSSLREIRVQKNGKGFKQLVPSLKALAHKMNIKKTFWSKLGDLKLKALEMFDMYKDYGYLFFFNHKVHNLIVLVFSILFPIALTHNVGLG